MLNAIQQNTPEWLQIRKSKIGSSDAPVIMQVSPWNTPYCLWQQKLDLAPSTQSNSAMQRGHHLETPARLELEKLTGLFFLPAVLIHPENDWMMASVDAIDPEHKVIAEIKCPSTQDHNLAKDGRIPDKYYPQVQHQLEVCQLQEAIYFSFDGNSGVIVKVKRDDDYIKKMICMEKEFYECLQDLVPPKLMDRDYVEKTDDMWNHTAAEWLQITQQIDLLSEKEKIFRESLIGMCQNKNSKGSGVKLMKIFRKGSVDYEKIPEIKSIDLEIYRKKSSQYWKICASD
jgi:putative phage-type endonuclease